MAPHDFDITEGGDDDDEATAGPINDERASWHTMIKEQNRKSKKSGGFQTMGLSHAVFQGILKRGYKVPTPIQRKCIPILLEGRDVAAMSRTGSGKTAAFLIPLLERLRTHDTSRAPRALIMSPTRELALQTHKFFREIGHLTRLTAVVILGGDRLEDQFAAMHQKPDVLIVTPGRFLHLQIEMNLKFDTIEYVVIDEADRLFELGFAPQVNEIFRRLPESRQTCLFSATLPNAVVEFAKYGLTSPAFIRLDVDAKLSKQLSLGFFTCRENDKMAILMHVLRNLSKFCSDDDTTTSDYSGNKKAIVFFATKHHIDYAREVLLAADIHHTYIYSSLDAVARKMNMQQFRRRDARCNVLLATDVAARGVDIPVLDLVVNYHFPAKSKLFIHRVGRVARAGRSGMAVSLVAAPDEMPFLIDFHLFIGRELNICRAGDAKNPNNDKFGLIGRVPQSVIDAEDELLKNFMQTKSDISNAFEVAERGYGKYIRTRPQASSESIRRVKNELQHVTLSVHPMFENSSAANFLPSSMAPAGLEESDAAEAAKLLSEQREKFLHDLKSYRSRATVFELKAHGVQNVNAHKIMHNMRERVGSAVERYREKKLQQQAVQQQKSQTIAENIVDATPIFKTTKKRRAAFVAEQQPYINYKPSDYHAEKGLEIDRLEFNKAIDNAGMDFLADEAGDLELQRRRTKRQSSELLLWDRHSKKFTTEKAQMDKKNVKKIQTESGSWIPASYKTGLYSKWKKQNHVDSMTSATTANTVSFDENENDENYQQQQQVFSALGRRNTREKSNLLKFSKEVAATAAAAGGKRGGKKVVKNEILNADQIAKERRKLAKTKSLQKHRQKLNEQRSKRSGGAGGGRGGGKGGKRGGKSRDGGGGGIIKKKSGGGGGFGSKKQRAKH